MQEHEYANDVSLPVSCTIWEGEEVKKVDLTVLDIGWTIIQRVDKIRETCDYLLLGKEYGTKKKYLK